MHERCLGRRVRGLLAAAVVLAVPALAILTFTPGAFGNASQVEDFGTLAELNQTAPEAIVANSNASDDEAVTFLRNWDYTATKALTPAQLLDQHQRAENAALLARQKAERDALRDLQGKDKQRKALATRQVLERNLLQAHFKLEKLARSTYELVIPQFPLPS